MDLPDGFVIEERYVDRVIAQEDLTYYKEIMGTMFCPMSCKSCRQDCMFYSDGIVKTLEDGTFEIVLPICTIFLGGQR